MEQMLRDLIIARFDAQDKTLVAITKAYEGFRTDFKEIREKMEKMAIVELNHYDNCPVKNEDIPTICKSIERIDKEIQDCKTSWSTKELNSERDNFWPRMISKYPMVSFGIISFNVALIWGSAYGLWVIFQPKTNSNTEQLNQIEKKEDAKNAKYDKEIESILKPKK